MIRGDCKAMAKKFGLPYREINFEDAVILMMGGLYKTGQEVPSRALAYTSLLRVLCALEHVISNPLPFPPI